MADEQADTSSANESASAAEAPTFKARLEKLKFAVGELARNRWFRTASVATLISLPVLIGLLFELMWSLPASVVVAEGPEGGFYEVITKRLSEEIEKQTDGDVDVAAVRTDGSLTNLRLLQEGQVDFALYQTGTAELGSGLESCFTVRDKNEDGSLTLKEFVRPYPHDVFIELDRDANAVLTRDEYSASSSSKPKPDVRRGAEAFDRLDEDGDGLLSAAEYADTTAIEFVANIVPEAMHVIVDRDASLVTIEDLRDKRVALGPKDSGNYAAGLMVLEHCGLAERDRDGIWTFAFEAVDNLDYIQIRERLLDGTLDAALVNASIHSPVLKTLLGSGECQLLSVPHTEALCAINPLVSQYTIPQGIYRGRPSPTAVVPSVNTDTIAHRAQLLTRNDVYRGLVTRVTGIVLDKGFEKKSGLNELFVATNARRLAIASERPEFPIHRGALAIYQPIGIDYYRVEKWYALYSFIASGCVAGFVGYRWISKQRARNRVIKLERYVDALFDIERRQLDLDVEPNAKDTDELRRLLDAVTLLRQRALRDFSSHEVIQDPAVYCFVHICHFVSTKLDAKISRQRLDSRLDDLAAPTSPGKTTAKKAKKATKKKSTRRRAKKG